MAGACAVTGTPQSDADTVLEGQRPLGAALLGHH
jgi:hypothetical protein